MSNNTEKKILRNEIFNPEGSDSAKDRKIFGGNSSNFLNVADVKYQFGIDAYNKMMQNFWIPEKISLGADIVQYLELNAYEKEIFNDLLSSLTWLDSAQMNNLPNLIDFITAPEIKLALSVQNFQEALHAKSYNNIVHSVIRLTDSKDLTYFYRNWSRNKFLEKRNNFFLTTFQEFQDNPNEFTFIKALVTTYVMEGINFTAAFRHFYDFVYSKNMLFGTIDTIKLIHRDEDSHASLFADIINELIKEDSKILQKNLKTSMLEEIIKEGAELEKEYISILHKEHDLSKTQLTINTINAIQAIEYITNVRAKKIGLNIIYPNAPETDPQEHLVKVSGLDAKTGGLKESFFENTVTNYKFTTQDLISFDDEEEEK